MELHNQPSFVISEPGFSLPKITDLGVTPLDWTGSLDAEQIRAKKATPSTSGRLPQGYTSSPNFREWKRESRVPGYLSYGPYFEPDKEYKIQYMYFYLEALERGNPDEAIFLVNVVDHNDGGRPLIPETTFYVKQLCNLTGCNVEMTGELIIKPGMNIESRIKPLGGADIRFHGLHWGISSL